MREYKDKRILRSMRDLRQALLELLKTKPIDKISVLDICATAQINKMTFYKYYSDKYDLLEDCIRTIATEIYEGCIGSVKPSDAAPGDPVGFCVSLADASVAECIRYKDVLISLASGNNLYCLTLVRNGLIKVVEALLDSLSSLVAFKYPTPVVSAFLAGGFSNLIFATLSSGKDIDAAQLHEFALTFFTDIINSRILVKTDP